MEEITAEPWLPQQEQEQQEKMSSDMRSVAIVDILKPF